MQTFLPYADFAASAGSLDRQRLGKQRVENLQIMKALATGQGWVNHPATKMWAGYEDALLTYQEAICYEWAMIRGYKDTCYEKTAALYYENSDLEISGTMPPWLGDPEFHRAHQSNLIRKFPEHYAPQFPGVPDDLDYIWPVQ